MEKRSRNMLIIITIIKGRFAEAENIRLTLVQLVLGQTQEDKGETGQNWEGSFKGAMVQT